MTLDQVKQGWDDLIVQIYCLIYNNLWEGILHKNMLWLFDPIREPTLNRITRSVLKTLL
jgi:hypothetical protein